MTTTPCTCWRGDPAKAPPCTCRHDNLLMPEHDTSIGRVGEVRYEVVADAVDLEAGELRRENERLRAELAALKVQGQGAK